MSEEVRDHLDGLASFLENLDLSPLADKVRAIIEADLGRHFDEEVNPAGVAWAPLKEPRRPGRPNLGGILVDSKALVDSVLAAARAALVEGNAVTVEGDGVVEYAWFHEDGARGGSLPDRKFWDLSDQGMEFIIQEVEAFLLERLLS